jgi:hypothetical protein
MLKEIDYWRQHICHHKTNQEWQQYAAQTPNEQVQNYQYRNGDKTADNGCAVESKMVVVGRLFYSICAHKMLFLQSTTNSVQK